jgi:short-subunit dehydrogenase
MGLGRAIAVAAARRGANVVVGGRTREALDGALADIEAAGGTFVQIASALSYRGIPLQAAYCSTKAALRTFLESARVEQEKERSGVDICVILPGAITTPQFDRAGRFDSRARESTAWTWLRLHRGLIGAGAASATMGLLAGRSGRFPTR